MRWGNRFQSTKRTERSRSNTRITIAAGARRFGGAIVSMRAAFRRYLNSAVTTITKLPSMSTSHGRWPRTVEDERTGTGSTASLLCKRQWPASRDWLAGQCLAKIAQSHHQAAARWRSASGKRTEGGSKPGRTHARVLRSSAVGYYCRPPADPLRFQLLIAISGLRVRVCDP